MDSLFGNDFSSLPFEQPRRSRRSKLYLNQFKEIRTITDDKHNRVKNGQVTISYNDDDEKEIAMINYRPNVGQIGKLFVFDENNRHRGLGKQMVMNAAREMRNNGTKEIWGVSTRDFSTVFTPRDPAHPSVDGPGYFMNFEQFIAGDVVV